MTNSSELDEDSLSIIKGVLETAGKKSAESISMMIGSNVKAEINNLNSDAFELYEKEIEKEKMAMIVYSELEQGNEGLTLFILYDESARRMANILMDRDKDEKFGDFGEAEKSAVKEVGNIVIGNFLGEVSDYFNTSIMHSPPEVIHDMVGVYFNDVVGYTAMLEDAIIADVKFIAEGEGIEGKYLLIPSDELTNSFIEHLS